MSIYSHYTIRDQPRDIMIVARWEDDTSPLGRLFGWKREIDNHGYYVDESESGSGSDGKGGAEEKTFCMDNSFLFGFILGIGMGLMIADFRSMKESLRGSA
jgi:hypothetical protein